MITKGRDEKFDPEKPRNRGDREIGGREIGGSDCTYSIPPILRDFWDESKKPRNWGAGTA